MFAAIRGNGLPGLRWACTVAMGLLTIQFCVGMVVNLYVPVPASDATASWIREIETAPDFLTAHALLGLALLGAGAVLVIRAIFVRNRALIALCLAGLAFLLGAFIAGEVFVKTFTAAVSLWMALLTGLAMLCYVAVMAISAAGRGQNDIRPDAAAAPSGSREAVPAQRTGTDAEAGPPRHSRRVTRQLCGDDAQRQVLVAVHGHVGGDLRLAGKLDGRHVASQSRQQ